MNFEVEDDQLCIPSLDPNVADYFSIGPKNNEDSPLYLDENIDKGLQIDDISSVFHYELGAASVGGLDSENSLETNHELRYGDFDRLLYADEVIDVQPMIGLPFKDEDYILNVDFTKRVPELDYRFCEESGSDNLRSESYSSGTSDEAVLTVESSSPICQIDQNGQTNSYNFESLPKGTSERDEMAFNSFPTYHLFEDEETKSPMRLFESGSSYTESEMNMNISHVLSPGGISCRSSYGKYRNLNSVKESTEEQKPFVQEDSSNNYAEVRKRGVRIRLKRTRKPTQRYIEELLDSSGHQQGGMEEDSINSVKLKKNKVTLGKKHCNGRDKIDASFPCGQLRGSSPRQLPLLRRQESSAKHASCSRLQSDVGHEPVVSIYNTRSSRSGEHGKVHSDGEDYDPIHSEVKRRSRRVSARKPASDKVSLSTWGKWVDRRKKSRNWTLSEVMKLVDGISQFGVGRWTAVSRTFFSSSYRTSLDVRDKWRNLVRSCFKRLRNVKEEAVSRGSMQQIPISLMERVCHLASLHPYTIHSRKGMTG